MKKNITINLYGTLYAIDEDACRLLEQYLDSVKSYFGRREGGDEIADDIEHRVAELFVELKDNGTEAISIENVRDIIQRIGNPEQLDVDRDEEDASAGAVPPPPPGQRTEEKKGFFDGRRLYRNPDDKMLGGVMSGICCYFGGNDALPWRIIMLLLAFFSFSTIGILYLIAWALIPEAASPEDKLRMRGKPVNMHSINEELMSQTRRASDYIQSTDMPAKARGLLGTLLNIVLFLFKLVVLCIVGGGLIAALFAGLVFCYAMVAGASIVGRSDWSFIEPFLHSNLLLVMVSCCIISALVCLSILLYALIRSLLLTGTSNPMGRGTRVSMVAIGIISFIISAALIPFCIIQYYNTRKTMNTVNQVYMEPESVQVLENEGWQVGNVDNCNNDGDFYQRANVFGANGELSYLYTFHRYRSSLPMTFNLYRTADLPAGTYHLEGMARTDGVGVNFYVQRGGDLLRWKLPTRDANGNGNIATMPYDEAMKFTSLIPDTMQQVSWETGYCRWLDNWSLVRGESFKHPGGKLTYGLRTYPSTNANLVKLYRINLVADTVAVAKTQPEKK